MFTKNKTTIHNRTVEYYKVNSDINGNPRYVIHWLEVANTYPEAVAKAHSIGGGRYRAKWYGGGIVFQSYSLESDFNHLIKTGDI